MTVLQLKRSMDAKFRRLETQVRGSEERTRRHFDVVIESLRDDLRIFAEAIGSHSDRLGDHEARLRKLERLT